MSNNVNPTVKAVKMDVDIIIIGGGIAGLWTLARLSQADYHVVLLEADQLSGQQSGASQGIIHGGTKYALTGKLTHSSQAIAAMPQRWQACLIGQGEIDLREAKILSKHQYLWSTTSLTAKITGFFATKVMRSRMQRLKSKNFIAPFTQKGFTGDLYQLDEPVIDIQSVIRTIKDQFSESILQAKVKTIDEHASINDGYQLKVIDQLNSIHTISCQALILTAGEGNEKLLAELHYQQPTMQRRPLLMPMLKAKSSYLPNVYAHCLTASALPKMTITSHSLSVFGESQTVWYLGGEIAEQGVGRTQNEQIKMAKKALSQVMPWMDFSQCQWSTLAIDRAEPAMKDGSRPIEPEAYKQHQVITAWPVKLAMTPIMVDKIMEQLSTMAIKKREKNNPVNPLLNLEKAQVSPLPWEKVEYWL
jgi:glycerol-3-phosphate dehydrogenase